MIFYGQTNIGNKRQANEDSFFLPIGDKPFKLFIVADGMGGYAGGKIASELAINSLSEYIYINFEENCNAEENIASLLSKRNSICK